MTTEPPNFDAMTPDQIADWLTEADDITPWREWARPTRMDDVIFVQVDEHGQPVPRPVSIAADVVARVDSIAGPEHRAEWIAAAIDEKLQREAA